MKSALYLSFAILLLAGARSTATIVNNGTGDANVKDAENNTANIATDKTVTEPGSAEPERAARLAGLYGGWGYGLGIGYGSPYRVGAIYGYPYPYGGYY